MVYFLILIISPVIPGLSLNQYDSSYLLLISSIILIFAAVLVFVTKLYQLLVVSLPAWFYINFVTYLRYFTDEILIFKTNTYNIYFKDRFNFKIDIIKDYANEKLSDRSGVIQNELTESNIISKSYDYFFKIIDTLVIVEKEELVVVDPSFFDKYGIYIITGLIVVTAVVVVFLIINTDSTVVTDQNIVNLQNALSSDPFVDQTKIDNFLLAVQQAALSDESYNLFCQAQGINQLITNLLYAFTQNENTVMHYSHFVDFLNNLFTDCNQFKSCMSLMSNMSDDESITEASLKIGLRAIRRYYDNPDRFAEFDDELVQYLIKEYKHEFLKT